ncbi:MAG: HDIG domain-containing protein [Bacteroidales bacterium]|nr:HDIG domain-containing protein [Bacteroidales bacterium]
MNKKIKRYYNMVYKIILYIISFIIILYLFPTQGKFRYEFQKGNPWKHESFIAPFDFAIKKSDNEIKNEKDSLLKDFMPYFQYDTSIVINQKNILIKTFNNKWKEYYNKEFEKNINKKNIRVYDTIREFYLNITEKIFSDIYSKGVVEFVDILDKVKHGSEIVIIKGKIAEEIEMDKIFYPKLVYKYIKDEINRINKENISNNNYNNNFLNTLLLHEIVKPNLFYDKETSEKIKGDIISEISLNRGMVQAGERIISKGEVVDYERFMILKSLKYEYESVLGTSSNYKWILLGQMILIFSIILVIILFLINFRNEILKSKLKITFIFILVLLMVSAASYTIKHNIISLYLIPFVILPIIIRTFYDARLALFIHVTTMLLIGFIAPNGFEFIFLQFVAGIVAIFSLTSMHRRGQLFISSVLVVITYSIIYFGIAIIQEGDYKKIELMNFAWFAGNGLLLLSSYPLIYIFEKLFGFLSDVTLMELSDTNQPLLRKLAEKAPGTFQHSMQVSNLAEAVIFKIGGNPLLVRTSALYHDIGKTDMPQYFIENQTIGANPHDKLEFDESAKIIISHVDKGIKIAKKHKLPEQIIDFIKTHHGTTKVQYFYRSFINKYPEKEVDIKNFTYPGPKPLSKETAVLMMADSVEAASKSLKVINEDTISELVEKIVNKQIEEEQFSNSDITFRDISISKRILKEKLLNIYHARIEYPEEKNN